MSWIRVLIAGAILFLATEGPALARDSSAVIAKQKLVGRWRKVSGPGAGHTLVVSRTVTGLRVEELDGERLHQATSLDGLDGPPWRLFFGRYEGQGTGFITTTVATRVLGRVAAVRRRIEKRERWGALDTLSGRLPERSIDDQTFTTDGQVLRVTTSRRFFHKAFGLLGRYRREFSAPNGNTRARSTEEYVRIE